MQLERLTLTNVRTFRRLDIRLDRGLYVVSGPNASGKTNLLEAIALLANMAATGAILAVLILVFGPISGAHFNPAVTVSFVMQRTLRPGTAAAYIGVQVVAALAGVALAHLMFDEPLIQAALKTRSSPGIWAAEVVATAGLVATIKSVASGSIIQP